MLCGRAGASSNPGLLQTCTEQVGVRVQNCVPSNGTKEMLHREHGAMFARIGTVTDYGLPLVGVLLLVLFVPRTVPTSLQPIGSFGFT